MSADVRMYGQRKRTAKTPKSSSESAMAGPTIRIAVIDDHPLYRDGVVQALKLSVGFQIVAEGASGQDAIRIARDHLPEVMLLDLSIPGCGIETAREIARSCPAVKILFLTASEADADVFACLEAGGRGYVLKGIGGSELANMVTAVNRGETTITPSLAGRLLSTFNKKPPANSPAAFRSDLTQREDEILEHVSGGLSNKEVANKLNLTEKTVKHYMTNIMQKLQVRNRVEAAMARRSVDSTISAPESKWTLR